MGKIKIYQKKSMGVNCCLKVILLVSVQFFLMLFNNISAQKEYRRCYIIAWESYEKFNEMIQEYPANHISQHLISLIKTGDVSTSQRSMFHVKTNPFDSESLAFDETKDQIIFYEFGIDGTSYHRSSYYGDMYEKDIPIKKVKKYQNELLRLKGEYKNSYGYANYSIEDFLNKCINSVQKTHCYSGYYSQSNLVFPTIMSVLPEDIRAEEYYLIIVSKFDNSSTKGKFVDFRTLKEIGYGFIKDKLIDSLLTKLYMVQQYEFCYLVNNCYPGIVCNKINPVLSAHNKDVNFLLNSNLKLVQNIPHGNVFRQDAVRILFSHNNDIVVDSICEILYHKSDEIYERKIDAYSHSEVNGDLTYEIKSIDNMYVPYLEDHRSDISNSDAVQATFCFYFHQVLMNNPKIVLNYVYKLPYRELTVSDIEYAAELDYAGILSLILLILLIITLFAYMRGLHKMVDVKIGGFAQKYVDVNAEKGAVEMPCWFYDTEKTQRIHVEGTVKNQLRFALSLKPTLYVRLQSKAPIGFTFSVDGKIANDYIAIETTGRKRNFNFNVLIQVDTHVVNPDLLHTCEVELDFKIKSFKWEDFDNRENAIQFYFTRMLGTTWVGLDPGTTGSCIAYGGSGGTVSNPNIRMVEVERISKIIPSKIVLHKSSIRNKQVSEMKPGEDYRYGYDAERNWSASITNDQPHFQSIKKLLGYKNTIDDSVNISWRGGSSFSLLGVELAHLLVKGLYKDLCSDITSLSSGDKEMYLGQGREVPKRCVVAIPNNYTLPKTLDMVKSVKMLEEFKEIRFIYEAEGILFDHLRKEREKTVSGLKNILIFDMGGATINASVFQIMYKYYGDTMYYDIKTLARIGYAVGGDNIDVAIMEYYTSKYAKPEVSTVKRRQFQIENKDEILQDVFSLKCSIVDSESKKEGRSYLMNSSTHDSLVNGHLCSNRLISPVDTSNIGEDRYYEKIISEIVNSPEMRTFVIDNVKDAVAELLSFKSVKQCKKIDEVIFSGRSSLFPGISSTVELQIKRLGFKSFESVSLTVEEAKTAVAKGACWYGIYNGLIKLDNTCVSSAYGYKYNGRLVKLIDYSDTIPKDAKELVKSQTVDSMFNADGNIISYYQIMGSGEDNNVFSEDKRHKVNFIGNIPVVMETKRVSMSVDRRNVVCCQVEYQGGQITCLKDIDVVGRDITKENDYAYLFATCENKTSPSEADSSHRSNQDAKIVANRTNNKNNRI